MKVYLIRTPEYGQEEFNEVVNYLNQSIFMGSIEFIASNTFDASSFPFVEYFNCDIVFDDDYLKKKHLINDAGIINTNTLSWDQFFSICNYYREQFVREKRSFVVLLTKWRNPNNFFSLYNSNRDIVVHTDDWEKYIEDVDVKYPIAHQVIEKIINCLMDIEFDMLQYIKEPYNHSSKLFIQSDYIHITSKGCINDFCESKHDVIFKLKTADICSTCLSKLADNINIKQFDQITYMLRDVRDQFVYNFNLNTDVPRTPQPYPIIVKPNCSIVILTDIGNQRLNLFPKQKALYIFFLQNVISDIKVTIGELHNHQANLENLYLRTSPRNKKVKSSIELITNKYGKNFLCLCSDINRQISKIISYPELAKYYQLYSKDGQYFLDIPKGLIDIQI